MTTTNPQKLSDVDAYIQQSQLQLAMNHALTKAALENNTAIVKGLVERGAEPFDINGDGALEHRNITYTNNDIFDLLVKHMNVSRADTYTILNLYMSSDLSKFQTMLKYDVPLDNHHHSLDAVTSRAISVHLPKDEFEPFMQKVWDVRATVNPKEISYRYKSNYTGTKGTIETDDLSKFAKFEYEGEISPEHIDELFHIEPPHDVETNLNVDPSAIL